MTSLVHRFAQSLQEMLIARKTSDPQTYLVTARAGQCVVDRLSDKTTGRSQWEPVTSAERLLAPLRQQLCQQLHLDAWARVWYLSSVTWSCQFLARVARDIGASLCCPVDLDHLLRDGLLARQALILRKVERIRHGVDEILSLLTRSLLLPLMENHQDSTLRLQVEGNQVNVVRLSKSGSPLGSEPLSALVERADPAPPQGLLERLRIAADDLTQSQEFIERILSGVCPQVAQEIVRGRATDQKVGFWMFSGQAQGFPAEGFLFLDPPQEGKPGRVIVTCNRAHAEFVLQNCGGDFFWFPPAQVSCKVCFDPWTPTFTPCRPEIRIPRGFLPLVHPYVGAMQLDKMASFAILNSSGHTPAMLPTSGFEKQLGLTPRLAVADPQARDMCLSGQDEQIRKILVEARDSSGEIRPYLVVEGIWRLAIQGLTRAHESNTATPLVSMQTTSMLFPVIHPKAIWETPLVNRLFPYHP